MARAFPLYFLSPLLACWTAAMAATVHVDDSTRALSAAAQAELESELAAFQKETGVLLTLKAISYLESGVTMRTAAREARKAADTGVPSAIIMIDRGKNGLGISHSPELWQRYPLAEMVEVLRSALMEASDPEKGVEDKLLATSRRWMADVRALEEARKRGLATIPAKELPLVLGFVAALALVGLGGRHFAAKDEARRVQLNQRFHLPEVAVGQRLGAPFGGGHMVFSDSPRKGG